MHRHLVCGQWVQELCQRSSIFVQWSVRPVWQRAAHCFTVHGRSAQLHSSLNKVRDAFWPQKAVESLGHSTTTCMQHDLTRTLCLCFGKVVCNLIENMSRVPFDVRKRYAGSCPFFPLEEPTCSSDNVVRQGSKSIGGIRCVA